MGFRPVLEAINSLFISIIRARRAHMNSPIYEYRGPSRTCFQLVKTAEIAIFGLEFRLKEQLENSLIGTDLNLEVLFSSDIFQRAKSFIR